MTEKLVDCRNVGLSYPVPTGIRGLLRGGVYKSVLENISFDLKRGDRLALVGLNGSGKSTLLRLIAGIYPPSTGTICTNDDFVALFNIGIGMKMEATGRKNIILQCLANGLSHAEAQSLSPEIIEFAELGHVIDEPIHTYSLGMSMRLSFSVATALRPKMVLLDEWIGAGDAKFRAKAQSALHEIVSDSSAMVLASHNTALVRKYCNKGLLLVEGKIQALDEIDVVLRAFTESVKGKV